jgi:CTP synthase (UTP-ammonia lyase)
VVIAPLACSLVRQQHPVHVRADSLASRLYGGAQTSVESFYCSYGLVEEYVPELERHGLRVSGVDDDGQARIVELGGHRFFVATLFLPQMRERHPLVEGFLAAAST